MTFLELVNRARQECGMSGSDLSTLGGTLSQQNQRMKNWVNQAWLDLQGKHRTWTFMQREFSLQTVAGTQAYAYNAAGMTLESPTTSFSQWKRDTLRAYRTSIGVSDEQIILPIHWEDFRNLYIYGSMRTTQQRPVQFAIDPQKRLQFGCVPDDIYTVVGEYFQAPNSMAVDGDTPGRLETEFHIMIVYGAMMKYGLYEAAPEVLASGEAHWNEKMNKLVLECLPEFDTGEPLA